MSAVAQLALPIELSSPHSSNGALKAECPSPSSATDLTSLQTIGGRNTRVELASGLLQTLDRFGINYFQSSRQGNPGINLVEEAAGGLRRKFLGIVTFGVFQVGSERSAILPESSGTTEPNGYSKKLTELTSQPDLLVRAIGELADVFQWVKRLAQLYTENGGFTSGLDCLSIAEFRHDRLARDLSSSELVDSLSQEGRDLMTYVRLTQRSLGNTLKLVRETTRAVRQCEDEASGLQIISEATPKIQAEMDRAAGRALEMGRVLNVEIDAKVTA